MQNLFHAWPDLDDEQAKKICWLPSHPRGENPGWSVGCCFHEKNGVYRTTVGGCILKEAP
jgi:hypothetical protein